MYIGREEKVAISLLLAVVAVCGLLCLVLEDAGKESFASPYSQDSGEGDLVVFDGVVERVAYTNTGGHIIIDSGDAAIFIKNGAGSGLSPEPGMSVHAVGTLENYKGELEIYISNPSDAVFSGG